MLMRFSSKIKEMEGHPAELPDLDSDSHASDAPEPKGSFGWSDGDTVIDPNVIQNLQADAPKMSFSRSELTSIPNSNEHKFAARVFTSRISFFPITATLFVPLR
jgi:hypothetical protein